MTHPSTPFDSRAAVIATLRDEFIDAFKLRRGTPRNIARKLFQELKDRVEQPDVRTPRGFTRDDLRDQTVARTKEEPSDRGLADALRAVGNNLRDFNERVSAVAFDIAGTAYAVSLLGPTAEARGDTDADRYWIQAHFREVARNQSQTTPPSVRHEERLEAARTLLVGLLADAGRSDLEDRVRDLIEDARGGPSLDRYIDDEMRQLLRDVDESVSIEGLTPQHRLALRNAMFHAEAEYLELLEEAEKKLGAAVASKLSALDRTELQRALSTDRSRAWVTIFALAVVWAYETGEPAKESFHSLIAQLRERLPERLASPYFQRILQTARPRITELASAGDTKP